MNNTGKNSSFKFITFVQSQRIDGVVELILFRLGFKCSLQGTEFLKEAIIAKYTTKINSLSKQLYPQIAARHQSNVARVERSIRHAINACYSAGNLARANEILGWQIIDSNYPPTNSEFISAICTWIRLERMYANSANRPSVEMV